MINQVVITSPFQRWYERRTNANIRMALVPTSQGGPEATVRRSQE